MEYLANNICNKDMLRKALFSMRATTLALANNFYHEDWIIQSMEECSPIKWHLAHTSWFFEQFILCNSHKNYKFFNDEFLFLFNSYYNSFGELYPRAKRGMITRPNGKDIVAYRLHIDTLLAELTDNQYTELSLLFLLGIAHEQQHQELLLTDITHALSFNPTYPRAIEKFNIYTNKIPLELQMEFQNYNDTNFLQGHSSKNQAYSSTKNLTKNNESFAFHFDNEAPNKQVFLPAFACANRPVNNGEYQDFINDGGYDNPLFWLSDGWDFIKKNKIKMPLYWQKKDNMFYKYNLHGLQEINNYAYVENVSFYEANAFACWAGKRLLSEAEWEYVATCEKKNFNNASINNASLNKASLNKASLNKASLNKASLNKAITKQCKDNMTFENSGQQLDTNITTSKYKALTYQQNIYDLFGCVWEWTSSAYQTYPRYKKSLGALGEYNAKFAINQMVLKGGSSFTPRGHMRISYRNFYPPQTRWQKSGIRLAMNHSLL